MITAASPRTVSNMADEDRKVRATFVLIMDPFIPSCGAGRLPVLFYKA